MGVEPQQADLRQAPEGHAVRGPPTAVERQERGAPDEDQALEAVVERVGQDQRLKESCKLLKDMGADPEVLNP